MATSTLSLSAVKAEINEKEDIDSDTDVSICKCGKCIIKIKHNSVLFGMRCHCKACRHYYNNEYSTVACMLSCNVISITGPNVATNAAKKTKARLLPFSGVQRYKCASCDTVTHSQGYGGSFFVTFLNYQMYNDTNKKKLHPICNIFYSSRDRNQQNNNNTQAGGSNNNNAVRLPTYYSDFMSVVAFTWYFFSALFTGKTLGSIEGENDRNSGIENKNKNE